jgi:hypothetical protein
VMSCAVVLIAFAQVRQPGIGLRRTSPSASGAAEMVGEASCVVSLLCRSRRMISAGRHGRCNRIRLPSKPHFAAEARALGRACK